MRYRGQMAFGTLYNQKTGKENLQSGKCEQQYEIQHADPGQILFYSSGYRQQQDNRNYT